MQVDSNLQILESAVDWLTVTCPRGNTADQLIARAQCLLHQAESAGNRVRTWKGNGYHGLSCGGISHGRRYDGAIFTLRSREALRSATSFMKGDYNVTRLDLQTTVFDKRALEDRAHLAYYSLLDSKKKAGRPISANLRLNSNGGQTLYLGSTTSDRLGRLYDKGVEKKVAKAGECWRYEVQYRRDLAKLEARRVYQSENRTHYIAATVTDFFQGRGVIVPRVAEVTPELEPEHETLCPQREETDNERGLRWLTTNVAPTVERLVACGLRQETLDALGLSQTTSPVDSLQENTTKGH